MTWKVTATTTTSTLDWTNTSYAIRAVAYNGINGTNGTNGASGTNGAPGAATFVITRSANDSSAPTNAEVSALLGRTPVAGDICTVSYNAGNNAVVYRYVTTWVLFQTYITGSLIVQNTITSDKLSVSQLSAISANMGTITAGDVSIGSSPAISGTTMTGTGAHIYADGRMVVGNSSYNINWNNSALTVNGDIISTGNIINDAVSIASQYFFVNQATNDYTVTVNFTAAVAGTYIAQIVGLPLGAPTPGASGVSLFWNTLNPATEAYGIAGNGSAQPPMSVSFQSTMSAGANSFQARIQLLGYNTTGVRGAAFFITLLRRFR